MVHEIPIPGTEKKMIVEKDQAGNVKSVKDEKGNPAKKVTSGEVSITIKSGAIEAVVIEVPNETTLITKHNPTCAWYFYGGTWHYICS